MARSGHHRDSLGASAGLSTRVHYLLCRVHDLWFPVYTKSIRWCRPEQIQSRERQAFSQ